MQNERLVIIVGAARSGTKILRDVAEHPDFSKVPYDITSTVGLETNHLSTMGWTQVH